MVENFSRLRRRAFTAILEKRMAGLPVSLNGGGHSEEEMTESPSTSMILSIMNCGAPA